MNKTQYLAKKKALESKKNLLREEADLVRDQISQLDLDYISQNSRYHPGDHVFVKVEKTDLKGKTTSAWIPGWIKRSLIDAEHRVVYAVMQITKDGRETDTFVAFRATPDRLKKIEG